MSIRPMSLLPTALAELFAQTSRSGQVSLNDRYGLMAAVLQAHALTEDERNSVDRLLFAAQKGRLTVNQPTKR